MRAALSTDTVTPSAFDVVDNVAVDNSVKASLQLYFVTQPAPRLLGHRQSYHVTVG